MENGGPERTLRSPEMRRAAVAVAASVLLAGPAVLAFFAGGYFDGPRLIATLVAWAVVLVAVVCCPQVLPGSWPGRAALVGTRTWLAKVVMSPAFYTSVIS